MSKKRVIVKKRIRKAANPVFVCQYPCGCTAKGPAPLPAYCPEHGIIERPKVRTANQHPFADISSL